ARVWDAATGEPVTPPLKHGGEVHYASFSPDGRRVATASEDGTARVWDAVTGEPVTPPLKHAGAVARAAFTPDGRRLVAQTRVAQPGGGLVAEERLWDLATTDRPAADLVRQAQLRTSHRIDATGSLVPLDPDAVRQEWQGVRAGYPDDSASSPA